ncbi:hypothetical protein LTR56_016449 [Elasticomyces elasticus]|nr:hypothetical protein LTR56_016449 [Elasticomyces elasticus]KAK4924662.1 hypothetical protein LTR49_008345 [Elasticomyces elasticus]
MARQVMPQLSSLTSDWQLHNITTGRVYYIDHATEAPASTTFGIPDPQPSLNTFDFSDDLAVAGLTCERRQNLTSELRRQLPRRIATLHGDFVANTIFQYHTLRQLALFDTPQQDANMKFEDSPATSHFDSIFMSGGLSGSELTPLGSDGGDIPFHQEAFDSLTDYPTYATMESSSPETDGSNVPAELIAGMHDSAQEAPQNAAESASDAGPQANASQLPESAMGNTHEPTPLVDVSQPHDTAMDDMHEPVRSLAQEADAVELANEIVKPPTLLVKALEAMSKKKGSKQVSQGNIMIVLDESNLRKTVRIDSEVLRRQLSNDSRFVRIAEAASAPSTPVDGISVLAVLEKQALGEMPVLRIKALNVPAPAAESVTSGSDDNETKVKGEPKNEEEEVARQSTAPPEIRRVHWAKAYDSLLRLLKPSGSITARNCGLPSKAEAALPELEAIVTIAEYYDCTPIIRSAFMSMASEWLTNRTLYPAIAKDPSAWLVLAVKLQSKLAYNEAIVHVIGLYPNVDIASFPDQVRETIDRESFGLHYKRLDIDQQLFMTTLGTDSYQARPKLVAGEAVSKPVTQHSHHVAWTLVNLWRDYITEHLSHVKAARAQQSVQETPTCLHTDGECLTVAGLYRTIHHGGDAYMPLDHMVDNWKGPNSKGSNIAVEVSTGLKSLKTKAAQIVAPLLQSTLHYEGRDKLPYLTCVEVKEVPWAVEDDEGEEDDMEVDE